MSAGLSTMLCTRGNTNRRRATGSARRLDDPEQYQQPDRHQHGRGEYVPPALEPFALDLITAACGGERQADDRPDRDRGEDGERSDRRGDAGGGRGEEHGQNREVGGRGRTEWHHDSRQPAQPGAGAVGRVVVVVIVVVVVVVVVRVIVIVVVVIVVVVIVVVVVV